jgi:hypothetical protein
MKTILYIAIAASFLLAASCFVKVPNLNTGKYCMLFSLLVSILSSLSFSALQDFFMILMCVVNFVFVLPVFSKQESWRPNFFSAFQSVVIVLWAIARVVEG